MKKYLFALAVIIALSICMLVGQAATSSIHIVEPGDSIWQIAHDYQVSVEELIAWNGLNAAVIYPSQKLKIKKVKSEGTTYIVKKGDTLFNIAKQQNISLNELMTANNISTDLIYPGDQLTLNGTKKASSKSTTAKKTTKKEAKAASAKPKAPPISTPDGKEMSMTATAYTAFCEGCSGTTYTGIDLRANPNQKVIAVDPSIIPLGSRVWVEGYGEAIAGDIGSAIKGNIIDVFIEKQQDAMNWGRKTVTIKILN